MKRIILPVALLLIAPCLFGQDVDKIINAYFKNSGGIDNWKNLQSMKIKAVMDQGQMQLKMTIYQTRDNMQRVEVQMQGQTIIQAHDGETGWMINPMMGSQSPVKMPQEMFEQMNQQKFESEFLDYKKKGHSVELEGTEAIEGHEAYKVKLTKQNGDIEYYFFNVENYVPVMQRQVVKYGPGKGQQTDTYIGDYRDVNGFLMPYYIDTRMNGQSVMKMTVEEYILNEDIDRSLFKMPDTSGE